MESIEQKDRDSSKDPVLGRISFDGQDVLEIGSGSGAFTLEHLTRAKSLLCLDPESKAIEDLKAQWARSAQNTPLDARPGKIEDVALPEEAFDIAVFSHSL
ncbi:MAG: methyltransferase domain-containing protein [Anaerolineae bacterium]|jgi:2-polyprenyl-3-methyl-5-hydroxy-6-metoxy-1,4-benzoquinol methylase